MGFTLDEDVEVSVPNKKIKPRTGMFGSDIEVEFPDTKFGSIPDVEFGFPKNLRKKGVIQRGIKTIRKTQSNGRRKNTVLRDGIDFIRKSKRR